jgi:hypothetical protein
MIHVQTCSASVRQCVVTVLLRSLGFVLILVGSLSLFIIFGCVAREVKERIIGFNFQMSRLFPLACTELTLLREIRFRDNETKLLLFGAPVTSSS